MSLPLKPTYQIAPLPPKADLETVPVLKALVDAKGALLQLKGTALALPNQGILIDTLAIQEAQASSEIENIVTTRDDLYRSDLFPELAGGPTKEVSRYRDALRLGYAQMAATDGLITNGTLIAMFRLLKQRDDGFRKLPGTVLENDRTGETIYIPPQEAAEIERLMADLERFINLDELCALDPLIKMALIHHQFESIHPFPDGNGRIGRILNVLYLTRCDMLDVPILYLSRHINRTKSDYYRLLQAVRETGTWEEWVIYLLDAIARTSRVTLHLVTGIRDRMAHYKQRIRGDFPEIYSQDLLNTLFRHPYTRIEFVMRERGVSRPTASKQLETLAAAGLLHKLRVGKHVYFVNAPLVELFEEAAAEAR